MKIRMSELLLLTWIGAPLFGQQAKLTVNKPNPSPGEPVIIEVNIPKDKNTEIRWTNEGEGQFVTETVNQTRVQFRPTKPGTVIIVCNISTPNGQDHPSTKLDVSGLPTIVPPAPPPPHTQPAPVLTGDLPLADMEYMVPSGWMGDAMAENNGSATLDSGWGDGCRQGSPSCMKIEYRANDGKVGWAAFAWQRVIEGGANWGESPGADFSHGGFRSLRVFAKGQQDASGNLPKVQFKSGGNVAPKFNASNRATYSVAGPVVQLTPSFREYCLSLDNRDLSNTVSPFTVVVTKVTNPRGAVIILDDVRFSRRACQ